MASGIHLVMAWEVMCGRVLIWALPSVCPGKTVVHQLSVSLEDLYNGTTRKLSLQKNIICRKCGGECQRGRAAGCPGILPSTSAWLLTPLPPLATGCGVREGAQRRCPKCHGSGMEVRIHQLGPSMIQQIQTVCSQCQGQGEWIRPRDCCLTCNGRKVVREKKILSVHLDKGETGLCWGARSPPKWPPCPELSLCTLQA